MTNPNKPQQPKFNIPTDFEMPNINVNVPNLDDIRAKADQALKNPEDTAEKVQSFYERNKKPILITGGVLIALKLNKRAVKKATVKAVAKSMKNAPGATAKGTESIFEIFESLKSVPGMSYVARGGKTLHVLGRNDVVMSMFGDFDKMSDADVNSFIVKKLTT